jgi:hypothetical protein
MSLETFLVDEDPVQIVEEMLSQVWGCDGVAGSGTGIEAEQGVGLETEDVVDENIKRTGQGKEKIKGK